MHLLVVDDCPTDQQIIKSCVEEAMPHAMLTLRSDCTELAQLLGASAVDCVLLDNNLPTASGLGVLNAFKSSASNRYPPIVMLTGTGNEAVAVEALKLGAADYLSKNGLSPEGLSKAVRGAIDGHRLRTQLQRHHDSLSRMSMLDTQTGLRNRAAFEDRLEHLVDSAERYGRAFALLVMDLVQVAPQEVQVACDAYMPEVAQRVRAVLRSCDLTFRLDQNRLAVLMETGGKSPQVSDIAKRAIESMRQPIRFKDTDVFFELAVGAASYPESAWESTGLIRAADRSLELAKASGSGFEEALKRPAVKQRSWFKLRSPAA